MFYNLLGTLYTEMEICQKTEEEILKLRHALTPLANQYFAYCSILAEKYSPVSGTIYGDRISRNLSNNVKDNNLYKRQKLQTHFNNILNSKKFQDILTEVEKVFVKKQQLSCQLHDFDLAKFSQMDMNDNAKVLELYIEYLTLKNSLEEISLMQSFLSNLAEHCYEVDWTDVSDTAPQLFY